MLTFRHAEDRPGPGWHAHGSTRRRVHVLHDGKLVEVLLIKQRWLHASTGRTRHDRPVWEVPRSRFALDVVVAALAAWLLSGRGLHHTAWPWEAEAPARRTVQRWAAFLAPHAARWLQTAREHLIRHVAPRHLEEILPEGGIPPPGGRSPRTRRVQASQLPDVVWIYQKTAHALSISLRQLLVVARWRWPPQTRPARAS